MLKLLKSIFSPTKEDLELIESINILFKEWDVTITPRGAISKISKTKYREKHRKMDEDFAKDTKNPIRKQCLECDHDWCVNDYVVFCTKCCEEI